MTGTRRFLAALLVLTMTAFGCSADGEKDRRAGGEGTAGGRASDDGGGDTGATGDGSRSDPSGTGTGTATPGDGSSTGGPTGGPSGGGGTSGTGGNAGGGSEASLQPRRPPGWRVIAKAPIKGRHSHSAVWTGTEMIVWGGAARAGNAPLYLADGAAYDPATDKWRKLPESPLGPRADHFAAWTGAEMLIWGGNPGLATAFGNNEFADGAAYDPARNNWRPIARFPLAARFATRVVWSGKVMVVWGGARAEDGEDAPPLADGAAYDPGADRWTALPEGPLAGRLSPLAAAVDGDVLISWGFNRDPGQALDGARFDPEAKTWAPIAPVPATDSAWCFDLAGCVGVDAGSRVIFAGEGLVYDIPSDRWAPVATSPLADPFRDGKAHAWTGNRVVLWGGGRYTSEADAPPNEVPADPAGMTYDPAADRWTPLPPSPIPSRARTRGVWTGGEFIVWGGESAFQQRIEHADGAAWTP